MCHHMALLLRRVRLGNRHQRSKEQTEARLHRESEAGSTTSSESSTIDQ
jgi:hypothetical protein